MCEAQEWVCEAQEWLCEQEWVQRILSTAEQQWGNPQPELVFASELAYEWVSESGYWWGGEVCELGPELGML